MIRCLGPSQHKQKSVARCTRNTFLFRPSLYKSKLLTAWSKTKNPDAEPSGSFVCVVGDAGFEPATPCVWSRCSEPTELIARGFKIKIFFHAGGHEICPEMKLFDFIDFPDGSV